jgi:hypothetical protein
MMWMKTALQWLLGLEVEGSEQCSMWGGYCVGN